jgi:hypothetical protein
MDDLNDPRISAYRPQRRILLPAPPGPKRRRRRRPTKAERKRLARAETRRARLHLVGLSDVGVIIMSVALAAVVGALVVVLVTHH